MEDYKKKYEQALSRASYIKDYNTVATPQEVAELLFPELKESEDERIRKAITIYLKSVVEHKKFGDKIIESWIAWLEKQGEQKPVEWSAYDKATLEYIIEDIKELCDNETEEGSIETYNREINLLQAINKSIKLSSYTNPAAWSEEDEKMFISLKTLLNDASCYSCTGGADKILSWLKSLKERMKGE